MVLYYGYINTGRDFDNLLQKIYYLIYVNLLSINFLRRHTNSLNGLNGNTYSFDVTEHLIGYICTNFGSKIQINTLRSLFKWVYQFRESKAVAQRYSVKTVFLKFSQSSQENICTRASFLIKASFIVKLQADAKLKKRLRYRCFPVNFAKFLRKPADIEHL